MSTDTAGPRRVRASDAEREELARILRAAMSEGRLSLADGEERLAVAYAATYRDELSPLTADLPEGGRRALFDTPEALADARRHLRGHLGFVVVVTALLIGLWALPGAHFFWPAIPLAFLALGLLKHARYRHWLRTGPPPWAGGVWGGRGWGGGSWGGRGWGHPGGRGWGGPGPAA